MVREHNRCSMFCYQEANKEIPQLKGEIDGREKLGLWNISEQATRCRLRNSVVCASIDIPGVQAYNAAKDNRHTTGNLKGEEVGTRAS